MVKKVPKCFRGLRTFKNVGTGSAVRTPKLRPSVVTFLGFHSELLGCLPPKQFSVNVVAGLFGLRPRICAR